MSAANGWESNKEAAFRLGVDRHTIYQWGLRGLVEVKKVSYHGIRPICLYRIKEAPKGTQAANKRPLTKQEMKAVEVLKKSGLSWYRLERELWSGNRSVAEI